MGAGLTGVISTGGRVSAEPAAKSLPGTSDAKIPADPVPVRRDVRAAKAAAVLETYCGGCHQADRLRNPGQGPAGAFGNIGDVEALAKRPALVRSGLPDASPLYVKLLTWHAPLAVFQPGNGPSPTEVDGVRDWIEHLEPMPQSCPSRARYGQGAVAADMARWLEAIGPEAAANTRFISLANLYDGCVSDHALGSARQAVSAVLNSLSWTPRPARVETVGDALALLAVRLSDIGWSPAHWEKLAAAEPGGGNIVVPGPVQRAAGSRQPVVRGDWLAASAMSGRLYYELMGIPQSLAEAGRVAGVDFDAPEGTRSRVDRAGVRQNAMTHAPRLIERFEGASAAKAVWVVRDFPASAPADEIARGVKPATPPDMTRMLFSLPNGLPAFAAFDGTGKRLDVAGGAMLVADEVRGALVPAGGPAGGPGVAAGAVPALGGLLAEDDARVRVALAAAGADPSRREEGVDPVAELGRLYDEDASLIRIAIEAGLELPDIMRRLEAIAGANSSDLAPAARRLLQGVSPRTEAERLLLALRTPAEPEPGQPAVHPPAPQAQAPGQPGLRGLDLLLASDRAVYAVGDLVSFTVRANADCYLTLISVDARQKATVLFPNDFQPDNLIAAGKPYRLPGDGAAYQLRSSERGQETTVAICQTQAKIPAGIELDYERQRFTILGNWHNFLNTEQAAEAELRAGPGGARSRARGMKPETHAAQSDPAAGPDLSARTAIVYRVD